MAEVTIGPGSLVLYKNRPGCVKSADEKLELALESGKTLSVRPKDVLLLHPGPLHTLDDLQAPAGEVETAWELLAGETTTLPELAELAYGRYTPATAWATWQLLAEGLYFRGTIEEVIAGVSLQKWSVSKRRGPPRRPKNRPGELCRTAACRAPRPCGSALYAGSGGGGTGAPHHEPCPAGAAPP